MFEKFTTVLVKEPESFSSDRFKITGLTGEKDVSTVFFGSVLTGILSGAMKLWSFGEQGRDSSNEIRFSGEGFPSKSSKSLWPSSSSSQKVLPWKLWNCIRWKVPLRLVSNYCAVLVVGVAFQHRNAGTQCRVYYALTALDFEINFCRCSWWSARSTRHNHTCFIVIFWFCQWKPHAWIISGITSW